jgi:hypothetical protein
MAAACYVEEAEEQHGVRSERRYLHIHVSVHGTRH